MLNTISKKLSLQEKKTFESSFGHFYVKEKSELIKSFEKASQSKPLCQNYCCNTNYKTPFSNSDFNFIAENSSSVPYSEFIPEISFAEVNLIPKKKSIQYKKHNCNCSVFRFKKQHCLLKNVFPTFHPNFGFLTSVVNQICIKKKCENRKDLNRRTNYIPLECRNIRQIILWHKSQIDNFFSTEVTSSKLIDEKHMGRICVCINHFSLDDQDFFWKNGYLKEDAQLFTKKKINFVTTLALYENNLLPDFESQNAGLPFPLNQVPFPTVFTSAVEAERHLETANITEKTNGESSQSDSSQLAELSIDSELDISDVDISFPNSDIFFNENIDSLAGNFELDSPSISLLTWDQFFSVANGNRYQNYYYGNYEMEAYLKMNQKSGEIYSFFLESKDKDKLVHNEIKLFNQFSSEQVGSLLLQAGRQGTWNNKKTILPAMENVDPHLILLFEILKDLTKSSSPLTSLLDNQNQILFEITDFIYSTDQQQFSYKD